MAIIRQVSKNTATGMYCFIELSDDVEPTFTILGGEYFATKEACVEYSQGFELDSYIYEDPVEIQTRILLQEKDRLENRLQEIQEQLPPEFI